MANEEQTETPTEEKPKLTLEGLAKAGVQWLLGEPEPLERSLDEARKQAAKELSQSDEPTAEVIETTGEELRTEGKA